MSAFGLAWQSLIHNRIRTLIAATGVAFAVLLLFLQLGFYGAVGRTATMLFDHLRFDLVIASSEHQDLTRMRDFPRSRLAQAQAVPAVAAVTPLTIERGQWRNPNMPTHWWSRQRPSRVPSRSFSWSAFRPIDCPGCFASGPQRGVPHPGVRRSHGSESGAAGHGCLRRQGPAGVRRLRVLHLPAGLGDRPAGEHAPGGSGRRVHDRHQLQLERDADHRRGDAFPGVLPVDRPGHPRAGRTETRRGPGCRESRLQAVLPPDVQVLTPDEANDIETEYWVDGNNIGKVLWATVLLAVVVGVIFLYQMMAADVRNRLAEFATAKALGYEPSHLSATVLWQAVLLACVGYLPGLAAAFVLYDVFGKGPGSPCGSRPSTWSWSWS